MKHILELTDQEKLDLQEEIIKRVDGCDPFVFYINNCVSIVWTPKWLWSAICDLVYWVRDICLIKLDMDIVWYYVNEIIYSDEENKIEKIVELLTPTNHVKKFIESITFRYI
jgi:hypothetical protein